MANLELRLCCKEKSDPSRKLFYIRYLSLQKALRNLFIFKLRPIRSHINRKLLADPCDLCYEYFHRENNPKYDSFEINQQPRQ